MIMSLSIEEDIALRGLLGAILQEAKEGGTGVMCIYVSDGSEKMYKSILDKMEFY